MRYAFVEKVGPDFPKPALLLGQSARTPPSARLVFGKSDSDHYTNLTAQMVLLAATKPVTSSTLHACSVSVGLESQGSRFAPTLGLVAHPFQGKTPQN